MAYLWGMDFSLTRSLRAQMEGKALNYDPRFTGDVPISMYQPGYGQQVGNAKGVLSQTNAALHADAYGGKQAIDWVYDAIGLYADPISSAPFRLETTDGQRLVRKKVDGTPPDHTTGPADLYRLLDKPNPFMNYDELVALLVMDLLLVGNAYWFKWRMTSDGKPLALYRLAPSYVKVVPGPFGPTGYEYQPPGAKDKLKISLEEMVHFRRPSPHSAYYGMGVVQGGGRAMDLELAVTDTMASYYENKADPSLIVQSERRVPRDVFKKLMTQIMARASGPRRAGMLLVLESGLKATTLSASASDALFDKLSTMSRDRILAAFRANPRLLGIADETAGADKTSDIRREFDNATLVPFMNKLQAAIFWGLTAAWDVRVIMDYRYQMPPDEAVKVAGEVAKMPGVKVREVRRQYAQFGIEESTGDNEVDEMILNMPTVELDANGQPITPTSVAGKADRPLPGEPGRPPKGSNTVPFPRGAKARPSGKAFADIEAIVNTLAWAESKAVTTRAPDNRLPGEVRPTDTFASVRAVDLNTTRDAIAAGLRDAATTLERDLLDHVEGKALKTSDLAGRIRNSKAWVTFRERITAVIEDGARQAAQSAVMHSGLTPDEELDYDAIVKSVVNRPEGIRGIVQTLKRRVLDNVKAARDADAERHDLQATIQTTLAEWSASQAEMVADSEATEVYNEATITAAEAAGVSSLFVVEEDDAPDDACQEANGQVWDLATARGRRKEHPRCRRAFLPVTADALGSAG